MPFITSPFLTLRPDEWPAICTAGYANLAVIGRFCEVPDDVVFSVEYSVRSAMMTACALLGIERSPLLLFKGYTTCAGSRRRSGRYMGAALTAHCDKRPGVGRSDDRRGCQR